MSKPAQARDPRISQPTQSPDRNTAEDPVEEASEESFPASDSPVWNASQEPASPAPTSATGKDKMKQGCAVSFLNEERGEMDKLCERTPAEKREEYTQPEEEKEIGGEG